MQSSNLTSLPEDDEQQQHQQNQKPPSFSAFASLPTRPATQSVSSLTRSPNFFLKKKLYKLILKLLSN
jgi:hypothetical protein